MIGEGFADLTVGPSLPGCAAPSLTATGIEGYLTNAVYGIYDHKITSVYALM